MSFPPVDPLPTLVPWGVPQTLVQMPRDPGAVRGPVPTAMPTPQSVGVRDPHHYALLSGSAALTIGTASALVLASPPTFRNMLLIRNSGLTNLYIDFGIAADTARTPLRLVPNAILIFDTVVPQDDMFAISDAAGGVLSLSYSNVSYGQGLSVQGI